LTAGEAAAEYAALLAPRYAGELRDGRRRLKRARSFYRNAPETRFSVIPRDIPEELRQQRL
jgi:hypothetical protein